MSSCELILCMSVRGRVPASRDGLYLHQDRGCTHTHTHTHTHTQCVHSGHGDNGSWPCSDVSTVLGSTRSTSMVGVLCVHACMCVCVCVCASKLTVSDSMACMHTHTHTHRYAVPLCPTEPWHTLGHTHRHLCESHATSSSSQQQTSDA